MLNIVRKIACPVLLCTVWVAGCTALPAPVSAPSATSKLVVTVLYPGPKTEVEMGHKLKFIARVTDEQGHPVTDAQLTVTVEDLGASKQLGAVEAVSDKEGTYRSEPWSVPHRIPEGARQLSLVARRGHAVGEASGTVRIKYSVSDALLIKYGFWLDAPRMKGIVPNLVGERGDARNGFIRWGGQIPGQHVLAENWVEVQWRDGRYNLDNAEAVRRFMLEQVGNLGFTPIRNIGPFEPVQFKGWSGWKVGARPQTQPTEAEFVVFYSPEMNKTYAIGTIVTLPPAGTDAHATLRESFEVHPEIHASGVAREPLPDLLPGPELLEPPLGARFVGTEQPIVLQWRQVKELAADEYYKVSLDYNYVETNLVVSFETGETRLTLPAELYEKPNCGVFNWDVTLMRRVASGAGSQPTAQPVSHPSLYWYVEWRYPPDVQAPFTTYCPNAQF